MKHERMNWEILEAIKHEYDDGTEEGKEIVKDCMLYLKELNDFKDSSLDEQILDWFNTNNYCIECGSKMKYYIWQEPHNELDNIEYETMGCYDCPCCGDIERR